jgi:hypothetical protein
MTASTIKVITYFEKNLGKTLVAFQCHNLQPSELNASELQKVRDTEKRLGISIVVVDA